MNHSPFQINVIGGLAAIDPLNDNADVFVTLADGRRFVGTFFTLQNIAHLMAEHAKSGESLSGAYFWASDMVIVRELSEESIRDAVADLLKSGDFESALSPANDDSL